MRVLALDSSTWWASLALVERDGASPPRVVGELGLEVRGSHAALLPRAIDDLLALAGWDRADPDGYVVTRGPGSFTGIRVGLGTIRGLGIASDRPCAAVTTLDALARAHGPAPGPRIAAISAGRGEFYAALYDGNRGSSEPVEGPWLDGPERLAEVARVAGAIVIPAHGTATQLVALHPAKMALAPVPRSIAAAAGHLALLRDALAGPSEATLAPMYLRPPDAELDARGR